LSEHRREIRPRFSSDEIDFIIIAMDVVEHACIYLRNEMSNVNAEIRQVNRKLGKYGVMYSLLEERKTYTRLLERLNAIRLSRFSNGGLELGCHELKRRLQALRRGTFVRRSSSSYHVLNRLFNNNTE